MDRRNGRCGTTAMRLGWTAVGIACLVTGALALESEAERAAVTEDGPPSPTVSAPALPTLTCRPSPPPPPAEPAVRETPATVASKPEPAAPQAVLHGSIRDEAGRPVPDLVVDVRFWRLTEKGVSYPATCRFRKQTDTFGEFHFAIPAGVDHAGVQVHPDGEGRWFVPPAVTARLGGPLVWHLQGTGSGTALEEDGRPWSGPYDRHRGWPEVHLQLERASILRGRVLKTENGRALPADRYTVRANWRHGRLGHRRAEQRTDEEGRFELVVPANAADLEVCVPARGGRHWMWSCGRSRRYREPPHPGLAPRRVQPGGPSIEFRLPEMHDVRGRVLCADGTALKLSHSLVPPPSAPSARVWAERLDDDDIDCAAVLYGEPNGTFVLRYAPAGRYRLCAISKADKSAEPRVGGSVVVEVPGPPVQIECVPTYKLEGRVVGEDIAGFWATWFPDARPTAEACEIQQCEDDGSFRFEDLEDEPGTLYLCREDDPRHGWVEHVRPSQGPVVVELTPGLTITGRVDGLSLDELGRVHVNATWGPFDQDATVDASGRFAMTGLRPGRYDLLVWGGYGRSSVTLARLAGVQTGSDVRIRVPP